MVGVVPRAVPKIIHQFAYLPFTAEPAYVNRVLRSELHIQSLHKDWCVVYWSDEELEALVVEAFPHTVAPVYLRLPPGVIRSDIARYVVVALFGGWYLDTDMYCVTPLGELSNSAGLILSLTAPNPRADKPANFTPMVANYVFASAQHHPFWDLVLDEISHLPKIKADLTHRDVASYSGPGLMSRAQSRLATDWAGSARILANSVLGSWSGANFSDLVNLRSRADDVVCTHQNLFSWHNKDNLDSLRNHHSMKDEHGAKIAETLIAKELLARKTWICSGGSEAPVCAPGDPATALRQGLLPSAWRDLSVEQIA